MDITDIKGTVTLNNNVKMPYFGLGVFKASDGREVIEAIQAALSTGYRLIDTASLYGNEKGVGQAVRQSGLPREEVFVTTKVWNNDQEYDPTLRAFDASVRRLGLDVVDLYLVHWPVKGKYRETWRALETLYHEGRVRAIGVSNFLQHHLEDLLSTANVVPAVNQIEFHPELVQQSLLDYCRRAGIRVEAWAPLMQGRVFELPLLQKLAEKYGKTVPQVVLRWNLQKGVITIPKSTNAARIAQNADIFDFEIEAGDVNRIDALDRHRRVGADPDNFHF